MQFYQEYTLNNKINKDDHCQGSQSAKIQLVEYGDYQCPYCGMAYPIVKQLQQDFGDNLLFVFRNFPLVEIHPFAFKAAESAEIANDYNKFWEMHDALYENQKNLDNAHLLRLAKTLELPETEFSQKLQANTKLDRVKSDFMGGVESGVNGTPSFYINDVKFAGNWNDYKTFKSVLQEVLDNNS